MSDLASEIQLNSTDFKDINHLNTTNKQTQEIKSWFQTLLARHCTYVLKLQRFPLKRFPSVKRFYGMRKIRKTRHFHKFGVHLLAVVLINWYCIKFEARSIQTTCKTSFQFCQLESFFALNKNYVWWNKKSDQHGWYSINVTHVFSSIQRSLALQLIFSNFLRLQRQWDKTLARLSAK